MTVTQPALQDGIDQLRTTIAGRVIEPGDADYDTARKVMLGGIDKHPAAVIQVANVDDIRRVLALARETGVELAVRSGGHSGVGYSATEGGIVLDVRKLDSLEIDPATKTMWAGSGLTASQVSQAAGEHGLAIGFGDTGSVGIGGITTGGGIGYLVRKFGLAIDNLLAVDIVTADGELLRADADTNADLFWAVRGGGGNFGVVTRFQYQLRDLPEIVGGILVLPVNAEILDRFVELAETAPDEMSTIANVMPCPPFPFVDEQWHGKLVIFGLMCFAGGAEAGEAAFRPFRDLSKLAGLDAPIGDMVKPMTYPEMFPPEDSDYHPLALSRNLMIDRFDRSAAEASIAALEASDAAMRAVQLRVLGGAMARVPWDATAFAHRTRRYMINVAVFYEGEHDKAARQAWVDDLTVALRNAAGATDRCVYVNFLSDQPDERVEDAYPPETLERLAQVKRSYDPENLFRLNANISPA
jgi:FAD/FMN-containing dehydrogenase